MKGGGLFMWPMGVASWAFRAESIVGILGAEGKDASDLDGFSVIWRVVVAGDARIVAALVVIAAPGSWTEERWSIPLGARDLFLAGARLPSSAF